jgi:hypothetical protein
MNEMDIGALDELTRTVLSEEVKRKKEKISIQALQDKAKKLLQSQLMDFTPEFAGFSINDLQKTISNFPYLANRGSKKNQVNT